MMKATNWEFRYRLWLSLAIIALGFWSPWNYGPEWIHLDPGSSHTWGWLAFELSRVGIASTTGFALVTALAIAAASAAAALRVAGTAYLGTATVFNAEMKSGSETAPGKVLAEGPYRYMRNPLYAGSYLTVVALAILMPPSGAAVALVLLALFILRLIFGEEAFLAARIGEPYALYCSAVPRLLPSLRPRVPAGGVAPAWGRAVLGEIFPIGVAASLAALSWSYDTALLEKAVVVSFGLSLVMRGLIAPKSPESAAAA